MERIFFATCFRQIMFFCAKNIFSSHLVTMAIGSANPASGEKTDWLFFSPGEKDD